MYRVKAVQWIFQGISLVKLERIARLRLDIHTDYLESGTVVAHGCAAGTAKKVKESVFRF